MNTRHLPPTSAPAGPRGLRAASATRTLATLAMLALLVPTGAFAEPAQTVRAVDLKATPKSDAKTVVAVPADATVDIVKREGAWVQLKSGKSTGWAKLFDVRVTPVAGAAPAKKGNAAAETLGLAMGTRGASVTTGVRGLDADMLAKATPNAQAFAKLESYARSKDQATAFARAGKLATRDVAFVDADGKVAALTPAGVPK